ncbi:DUF3090 domain-containing protein [Nocardioides mesophilus]|uniref:DUF3090 domain-containing protein n=1 Tax=Nocardioides mesophilus TaxID=433659 RepID=A0A7G9RAZ1_9ACTN|nr:DUF3090 domain-containing protein [Nocardioides mesophilus]QNN52766.1 DUF3090 domain-containing protein [Nocardioides mesophilus]
MASVIHSFDPPERFVAGTVGPPGQRTFFLQARSGNRVTSVALEKQQVLVLAERIEELLDELLRSTGGEPTIPAVSPVSLEDNAPLEQPIVEEFRAGTMTLSWDPGDERLVLEVFPYTEEGVAEPGTPEEEIDEPEPEEVLLVRLPAGLARAFSKRAQSVVSAGRQPCPFCGGPMDPAGHLCPRANGFRRTAG